MRRLFVLLVLIAGASAFAIAQRPWLGGLDALRPSAGPWDNIPYDGRFIFVRISYDTLPGGYWYRGQPAWFHGAPTSEQQLMRIMEAVTSLNGHVDETNTLTLEDPDIFKYPVLYLIEPSWWHMTDAEGAALRAYMDKGGFVIVDDFKTEEWMGGRGWAQFADNMARVDATARFVDLPVSHPIFHQFFDIESLDIFPQAYNAGRPYFRGYHEDNDPSQPLRMFVAYNTDISQFWEWSHRGLRPVADTNEAYKLGVNALMYGLLH
jgi:hypothetical protein